MALTVLVDREGRIAIIRAGIVDPLVIEADIIALLAERCAFGLFCPQVRIRPRSRLLFY
jgi:hypothetical protein